jgi:hypothetical protein
MNDITERWGFQRILHEAVRYRMLRDQYCMLRRTLGPEGTRRKFADILDREFAVVDEPTFDGRFLEDLAPAH